MQIVSIREFVTYYERLRARTLKVVELIPPDNIEWTYRHGKFTFGDMLRHLASIERDMYAENAQFKPSRYRGHGRELADGYEATMTYFHNAHRESMEIFGALTDEHLRKHCVTPAGASISVASWLRTLAEHEIHHRGEMYVYLGMLGIASPPLYGLTSEEVLARSQ